jgi:hypothetical protein
MASRVRMFECSYSRARLRPGTISPMIDSYAARHIHRLVALQRRAEDAWSAACAAGDATRAYRAAQHIVKAEHLIMKLGDASPFQSAD